MSPVWSHGPAPGFAALSRGDLQLLLNQPGAGGAGQAMQDGQRPAPGGWNRIQIAVDALDAMVDTLRAQGVVSRKKQLLPALLSALE